LRVLVADDEALVRHGLTMILSGAGFEVVAAVEDGVAAVTQARLTKPDVALVDLRMPVLDGIEATRRIRGEGVHVLVLTTYDLEENLYLAIRAGAEGFLLKTSPPEDLVHAVRVVARGEALVEPAVTRRLLDEFVRRRLTDHAVRGPIAKLTDREQEVLRSMCRGLSNAEIGQALHLSEGTVKSHVGAVLSKLGARDRLQAVVLAYESGWVRVGDA
jgi:DNA-binding NarL/FixJ family response regulator